MTGRSSARTVAILVLALLVLAGCGRKESESEEVGKAAPAGAAERPKKIRLSGEALARAGLAVEPVQSRALLPRVEATGEIVFDEKRVAVSFSRVDGSVENVLAFLDDPVHIGQPLVLLYCPAFVLAQSEYLQARRRADFACGRGATSDCAMARRILGSADGKLRLLGAPEGEIVALARTRHIRSSHAVLSPIAGRVIESHVLRGNAVKAGDPLFKIADLSRVWLDVDLAERDLGKVALGSEIQGRTTAFPGRVFRGRVIVVGGVVDERKRTLRVRAEMENAGGLLRPGMFVEARLIGVAPPGSPETVVVPEGAVQTIDGSDTVFVEERPGVYERRPVRVGPAAEGFVPVRDGLHTGERVVVGGSFILKAELLKGSLEE